MKASTAMALGRTMLKPVAGVFLRNDNSEGCAMGMVKVAAPAKFTMLQRGLDLASCRLPCGCRGEAMFGGCHPKFTNGIEKIHNAVVHLFNYHVMTKKDWTLDQLIDWLASVEPADPEEVVVVAPEPVEKEIVQEEGIPVCP